MKKLNKEQALETIRNGGNIVVKTSSRDTECVRTEDRLESLERLFNMKAIEAFELYLPNDVKVDDNKAIEVSLEEAMDLLQKGELIYGVRDKEEEEINNEAVLISFYRRARVSGKPVLIWKPD